MTTDRFSRNVFSWKPAGKMAAVAHTVCDKADDVSKMRLEVGDSKPRLRKGFKHLLCQLALPE